MSDPTAETTAVHPAVQDRPPWAWIVEHFEQRLAALDKVGGSRNPGRAEAGVQALFADMRDAIIENAQGLVAQKHGRERLAADRADLRRKLGAALAENKALKERLANEAPPGPPALAVQAVVNGQRFAERTIDLSQGDDQDRPQLTSVSDIVAVATWLPGSIAADEERLDTAETLVTAIKRRLDDKRDERTQLRGLLSIASAALGDDDVIDITEAERTEVAS